MKIDSTRRGGAMWFTALVLPLTLMPGIALGQTAQASSYGVAVRTGTINQKVTSAALPAEGGTAADQAGNATVADFVTVQDLSAIASGLSDGDYSDAVSSATLGVVQILGGLITADGVVAMATSAGGSSDTEGSSLANLVVNGVQITAPAPNTRVNLPGVGYVLLNEHRPTSGGITVNMIHVVLQQSTLAGVVTTGNIIVGSATSSVN